MTILDRRDFLLGGAMLAAGGAVPGLALGAMGPNDKFDLLVRNANVLDPSQNLAGKRDIGIRYGVIEAMESSIAPERANRVMDAGGKLVTPGLIDLHAHTYPFGSAIGIPADELVAHQCTTTVVSAGDAGANNIAAWRRFMCPVGERGSLPSSTLRSPDSPVSPCLSSTTSTTHRSTQPHAPLPRTPTSCSA
jgi:dihydroorotase